MKDGTNKQRGWALGGSNKERVRTAIEEAVKISNLMNIMRMTI